MTETATKKFISIEGNIGSGKSTLLANLRKELVNDKRIVFLKEPVDEWEQIQDVDGNTMLQKFYQDQEKYSFSFQMMAYISRLATFKQAVKENPEAILFVTERSLDTDKFVFAKMLYEAGKIESVNYQIYLKWFQTFADDFPIKQVVYVKANPEICYNRIAKRSRIGEDSIPLEYLTECNLYHERMMDKTSSACICQNQLIVDGNIDIFQNKEKLALWIQQFKQFVQLENYSQEVDILDQI